MKVKESETFRSFQAVTENRFHLSTSCETEEKINIFTHTHIQLSKPKKRTKEKKISEFLSWWKICFF